MDSFGFLFKRFVLLGWMVAASAGVRAGVEKWEPDIQAFEAADRASTLSTGKVMLYGSSSFRLWTNVAAAFPGVPIVNRGFGGSQLSDLNAFYDRVVVPHAPQVLLVYGGDNDIAAGKSADQVVQDFVALVEKVRRDLPQTRIAFVAIKPSPSRLKNLEDQRLANARLSRFATQRRRVDFLDVATPLLDRQGRPDPKYFRSDQLHLNGDGYEQWRRIIGPYLSRWVRSK
ncbi:MAG: hypothetical protein JNK85_12400 [Verrucomicrobiales bacterium]|nr:hypothetical protein [Verrucomicrobiales bacterium]